MGELTWQLGRLKTIRDKAYEASGRLIRGWGERQVGNRGFCWKNARWQRRYFILKGSKFGYMPEGAEEDATTEDQNLHTIISVDRADKIEGDKTEQRLLIKVEAKDKSTQR